MADEPWSDCPLTHGLVAQELERAGCQRIGEFREGIDWWEAPTGQRFFVDTTMVPHVQFLQSMIETIKIWVEDTRS